MNLEQKPHLIKKQLKTDHRSKHKIIKFLEDKRKSSEPKAPGRALNHDTKSTVHKKEKSIPWTSAKLKQLSSYKRPCKDWKTSYRLRKLKDLTKYSYLEYKEHSKCNSEKSRQSYWKMGKGHCGLQNNDPPKIPTARSYSLQNLTTSWVLCGKG